METVTGEVFHGTSGHQISFTATDLPNVPLWHGNLTFDLLFEGALQVRSKSRMVLSLAKSIPNLVRPPLQA
jgi:hypothetical protein